VKSGICCASVDHACVCAGSVSSKHLEFTYSDGDWFALDLGSSNGTKLNESQVPMMTGMSYAETEARHPPELG
jgi:pSer/pThr/pTyr-binding forkhead associated (FHA) protein